MRMTSKELIERAKTLPDGAMLLTISQPYHIGGVYYPNNRHLIKGRDDEEFYDLMKESEARRLKKKWKQTQSKVTLADTVKTFPSKSSPGIIWTTKRIKGIVICDCPGFRYRKTCRHVKEVLEG